MQFFVLWNIIQFKINTYFFAQIQSGGAEGVVVYILQFQFYRTSLVPAVYSGASFLFVDALTREKDNDGLRTGVVGWRWGGWDLFFIFHLPPDISEFLIVRLAFPKK